VCGELGFFVATLNQWHCAFEVFRLGERDLKIASAVVPDIGDVASKAGLKLHARRVNLNKHRYFGRRRSKLDAREVLNALEGNIVN
jgi:hypothetical protein